MKKNLYLLIVMLFLSFALVSAVSMERDVPTTASPGTFNINYVVSGGGVWGASIEDSITGNCFFPDGSRSYKSVMLSSDGLSKSVAITGDAGSCVFEGNYKFGTDSIVNFPDDTITIGNEETSECTSSQIKCVGTTYYTCSNDEWLSNGKVEGKCGYTTQTGTEMETETEIEPYTAPSISLDKVLLKLGNFDVTVKVALIIFLLLILGGWFLKK